MFRSNMSLESVSRFSQMGSNIGEKWRAGKEYYRSKRESIGPLFGYLLIMAIFIVCQTIVMAVISRRLIITSSSFFKELQERNWGELVNIINKTSQQILLTGVPDIPNKEFSNIDKKLEQYNKTLNDFKIKYNQLLKFLEADFNNANKFESKIINLTVNLKGLPSTIKRIQQIIKESSAKNGIKVDGLRKTIESSNALKRAFSEIFIGDVLFLIPQSTYDWPKANRKWLNFSQSQDKGYIRFGAKKEHKSKLNLTCGIKETLLDPSTTNAPSIHYLETNITGDPTKQIYNLIKFDDEKFFNNLKVRRLNVLFRTVKFKKIPDP